MKVDGLSESGSACDGDCVDAVESFGRLPCYNVELYKKVVREFANIRQHSHAVKTTSNLQVKNFKNEPFPFLTVNHA